ncbi:hypothetical protein OG723_38245 [Streptomyces sp. NBC_01278]|uniref:hypothetical protein n=1 Tax=unclassified Streptomyces TaxID=2593676 RepID=UPI002E0F8865|nr:MULTISPECIES: hypothetical protein [unclassified Streptomyces]WSR23211.1 hypothetical protein OG573_31485 [Streptomyces sp. NBC_01205]
MKLRTTLGATLGALTLVLSMAGSAQAAQGDFHYKYVDGYGQERHVTLHDPHSGKCINLHAVGNDDELPGYAPHNKTDTAVTVYLGANCEGPDWRLKAHGKPASDKLEVRSVRFDDADAKKDEMAAAK